MNVITSLPELRAARKTLPGPVGFIPTMGYLHNGHISLVNAAKAGCTSVVASIFVNPTQFGPNEDLAKYPRDLPRDLSMLEAAGVDLVWTPTPEGMYPPGFQTWVEVQDLTRRLEGPWCDNRSYQIVQCRRAGSGIFRSEGCPAGSRD